MTSNENQCGMRSAECGKKQAARVPLTLVMVFFLFLTGDAASAEGATPAVSGQPAVSVVSTPTNTAVPVDAVEAIEAHYRELVDLTAKVVQKNFLKSVEKIQTFEGTLAIKRPGKLRLDYTNGQLIVVDGKEAWFYSKKSSQAIRRTFKDFEQANIPVAFLLGAGAIRQDFDVSVPEPDKPRMLDLVPKKSGAAMKKLRLHADGAGRITRMVVHDRSGNTSDVQFSDVKEAVGLEDAQFRFKVPKGTEVIEQ
jgi:outer membrane lipoprotein carrier protein